MKRILTVAALVLGMFSIQAGAQQTTDAKMKTFIDALMKKMTLEEKLGQLNLPGSGDIVTGQAQSSDIGKKIREGKVGGLFNIKSVAKIREVQKVAVEQSRLKIPMIFGMDVIHGYETVFPIPLGLSCTWDMQLVENSARIAAVEASADGINWTFSPMVDICRDARWGRIAEGNGEDPFLGSQIAKAMVRGYQGNDLSKNNTIMSCVKHYALYGAAEAGRDYNTTDMSRQRMFNDYLPPYKAAADAGIEYTYKEASEYLYPDFPLNPLAQDDATDAGFTVYTIRFAEPREMKTVDQSINQIVQIAVPTSSAVIATIDTILAALAA